MSGTTLRRVMKELRDLQKAPIREFALHPVEENALELHFTMIGPPDSPYDGGIYHGRILIPSEYPFAPPDVVMLTPSGRFEVGKKVCLSVSSYHPERWKATWGIATVLHALRDHMATSEKLGIGAVDYPNAIRVKMAAQSRDYVCKECGTSVAEVWEGTLKDSPPATDVDMAAKKELLTSPMAPPSSSVPPGSPPGCGSTPASPPSDARGGSPAKWDPLPPACQEPDASSLSTSGAHAQPNLSSSSENEEERRGAIPTSQETTATSDEDGLPIATPSSTHQQEDRDQTTAAGSKAEEVIPPPPPPMAAAPIPPGQPIVADANARHMRVQRRGRRLEVHLSISMIDAWIYRLVAFIALIVVKKLLLDHWADTSRLVGVAWDAMYVW